MLDIIFFLDILNMIRTFSFLNDLSNDKNLSKIKKDLREDRTSAVTNGRFLDPRWRYSLQALFSSMKF